MFSIVSEIEEKINSFIEQPITKLFRKRYKMSIKEQIFLYEKLQNNGKANSPELLKDIKNIRISIGQLNRIRKEWGLNTRQGRPIQKEEVNELKSELEEIYYGKEIGLCLFFKWLIKNNEYEEMLRIIHQQIKQYKEKYPKENFRLLSSQKVTIEKKWKALTILSLLGIKKLSELDYKQHHMESILGYSYGYSTLAQFLGELERVNVQTYVNKVLSLGKRGEMCYIDGHLMAFWSRRKMHKGHITMLGRIMSGSNAVLAHNEFGEAIWGEYYPPDTHLNSVIKGYCSQIEENTGISQFIIDREVNSVEIAREFVSKGWDLICMLDSTQYKGPENFKKKFSKKLDNGKILYKADWSKYKENDPRRFVIAIKEDDCVVYWGTPNIVEKLTAEELILAYRKRSDIQENSIKHMIAHGALNTNYGTKVLLKTDRTQQRKIEKLDKRINFLKVRKKKSELKINAQNIKIIESQQKNNQILFGKRTNNLQHCQAHLEKIQTKIDDVENQKLRLGEPSHKYDRDFRKQTIMTFRTLWLENLLRTFISLIGASMKSVVSIEVFLKLFFSRPGLMVETNSKITYWLESGKLSLKYQNVLREITQGFNKFSLTSRGKQIFLEIEEFS